MTTAAPETPDISYTLGDTLYISGIATGNNLPALPWTGASAKINIGVIGGAAVIDHANVTLDPATGGYVYNGGLTAITREVDHEYEIEITFADTSKQTFPKRTKARIKVYKQIA